MLKHSLAELLDTIADLLEVASGVKTEHEKASFAKCWGRTTLSRLHVVVCCCLRMHVLEAECV